MIRNLDCILLKVSWLGLFAVQCGLYHEDKSGGQNLEICHYQSGFGASDPDIQGED